jgi:hypothetical protein
MDEKAEFDPGTPGAGARREYERRKAKREARTRERHPLLGGVILAVQTPPQSELAWERGAAGEEELAGSLARRCPEAIVLHDRRMPVGRANIDHIAIAPSGIWVIDAKRHRGRVEVRRPWFGEPELRIGGRNRTKLVAGLDRQVDVVRAVTEELAPDMPVRGCLCFVGGQATLPTFRKSMIGETELLYPRAPAKRLAASEALDPERRRALAAALAERFRAA